MTSERSGKRRKVVLFGTALVTLALVAGACDNKKDNASVAPGTEAPGTTTASSASTPGTTGTSAETVPGTEATTTTAAPKPKEGGKITVSVEAEVGNPWTPAKMQCDQSCQQRARTVFEPLAAIGDDLKVHPYLAESITPNADYSEWTVKLRPGIKFHDGSDLNSDAAIYSLQQNGKSFLLAAALTDVAKEADGSFKIQKIDDTSFTVFIGQGGDATKPMSWPSFDFSFTGQWGFMASKQWLDGVTAGTAREDQPVGTGPFVFKEFVPNEKFVVTKNPNYWQKDADGVQLPYLDEIDFTVITDSFTAEDALKNGEIDAFPTSNAQVIANLRADADKFPMIEQSEFGETFYVLLHVDQGDALSDQSVRCALYQAIDKQAINDAVDGGILKNANGMFSPGQEGYLEDNGSLPMDVEAAKAAITAYEAAHGPVKIIYTTTTATSSAQEAELLKNMWNAIGVDVDVQQKEQSALINDALGGVPGFQAFGWRNNAGIVLDNQYIWWHSKSIPLNFGRINDPVIDDALVAARQEPDATKREAYAEDINREFAKQCWTLPTQWAIWGIPHNPRIHGFDTQVLPDGSGAKVRDGAGFPGQFWMPTLWVDS